MNPTPRLRFVQRKEEDWPIDCQYPTYRNVKVLQQWWVDITGDWITATEFKPHGEWRDVTLETEND